ncbi:SWIM zinc finger family protein [Micromonospora sp. KC606]|uniref:SWIM zinc finger family protein n=1 Tax=Micromonospora sp. KC606 TaxID=2530379 RepID=UPI001FB69083|nr:SWIM zinc finger family protein [Micromonospora sp. KC606]
MKARSTRGAIGVSWWSRRFLEVLESFALGTRLTRGRAYARRGQVLRLDVLPGRVEATVQGSRAAPYRVTIELPPFPAALWEKVERKLAAQAFFSARLLAGDLPAELEQVFADAGAPLFPGGLRELTQRCNCPDAAVPCKHLAATFYLLAEAFDADPFELLHWRGRSRAVLLDRLRALRADATAPSDRDGAEVAPAPAGARPAAASSDARPAAASSDARPATASSGAQPATVPDVGTGCAGAAGALRVLAGLPATPLAEAVDRFWLPPVPLPDRPPTLATGPELLLRQIGAPSPAIGGPGLLERLRRAYRAFGDA